MCNSRLRLHRWQCIDWWRSPEEHVAVGILLKLIADILRNELIRVFRKMIYFLCALCCDIGAWHALCDLWLIASLRYVVVIKM